MAFDMKSFSLEGKVALVTGAAYGIGFAVAEAYAQAGAKIAFNCRGQKHMDEALAAYAEKGIDAKGYFCDVTKEDEVAQLGTRSPTMAAPLSTDKGSDDACSSPARSSSRGLGEHPREESAPMAP